jgi:ATP-dependent Lon protease
MNDQEAPKTTEPVARDWPEDFLILLPVRNVVLFPELVMPLAVGRPASIAAAQEAIRAERPIGLILQRDPALEDPGADDIYRVGTIANVLRFVTGDDDQHHLICQGEARFRILDFIPSAPFLAARVERLHEPHAAGDKELEARLLALRERALEALQLLPQTPQELVNAVRLITSAGLMADTVAGYMDLKPEDKQDILETLDIKQRMDKVQALLDYRVEVLKLSQKIHQQTRERMGERQREAMLREQMRSIQQELGEGEERGAEIRELTEAVEQAGMPEEANTQALREIKRLERMPEAAAEYSMVRTYLEWLTELPWSKESEDKIDIELARRVLDEDHYGLDKIKRRILEHLAVHKLNPTGKARSSVSWVRPASARPRWARASRAPWGASSSALRSAVSTTRPRFAATGAPISAPCPATSSRASARRAPAIRYSCSTRWTN